MVGSNWLTDAAERAGGRIFARVVEGAIWAVAIVTTVVAARQLQ